MQNYYDIYNMYLLCMYKDVEIVTKRVHFFFVFNSTCI